VQKNTAAGGVYGENNETARISVYMWQCSRRNVAEGRSRFICDR